MQAAFEVEMKTFTTDASLPSHQRCEIQSRLGLCLSRVEGEFHDVTASSSAPTKIIQAYERNIKVIKARVIDLEEFEQSMQAMLTSTTTAKTQLLSTMPACSLPVVLQLRSHYDELFSKEINADIRGVLAECLSICTQKIEAEESLDKEAAQFVEIGANLRKYARDKLIKKSKHDPVPSVVKCVSGTLIWGSHKTGPKVHHVEKGPSDMLKSSGILGPRSANIHALHDPSFIILSFCWIALTLRYSPNEKLHFHVSVSDGTSTLGGREIIDFVNRCSQPFAYPCC
jgi:hypothetical protein